MIYGIGVDTIQIPRIQEKLDKYGIIFAKRILGEKELTIFTNLNSNKAINFLSKRFAAKEAISKALGCGIGNPYRFTDIQILNLASGQPYVEINNKFNIDNKRIFISLADEPPLAIAFAIVST